jgi:hypothetical protein
MRSLRLLHIALLIFLLFQLAEAQGPADSGSLEVSGRVKIGGKQEKLTRKRFYLFRGGLQENSALLERIRSAEIMSRDCYYNQAKASPEFICWLQAEDCESPFCRTPSAEEIPVVPEFKAAYQKGMTQFRGKTNIAKDWLVTNLAPSLVSGFYMQKRSLIEKLLAGLKPLQSAMTDTVSVKSIFIDIPVGSSRKFTISNILPIEIGGKSYVWSCEVNIDPGKTAKLNLQVPEAGKTVKNCEVVVKDLKVCTTGKCEQK